MFTKEENPIAPDFAVWRGLWRGFGRVAEVGEPHEYPDGLLVPVRYTNGQYAVLAVSRVVEGKRYDLCHCEEVRSYNKECDDAIRYARGIPSIIHVFAESYKIGVTDGSEDLIVWVKSYPESIVHEHVVLAPR
jgi:hypothetical protein